MAIDERARMDLYRRLQEVLGPPEADTLMSHLPLGGWSELVTKHDLGQGQALTSAELRREMADLRTDLRVEMAELRTELQGEMAELRTELQGEMAELRTEMRVEFAAVRREMAVQTRQTVLALVPIMVAVNGVAVGLAALLG